MTEIRVVRDYAHSPAKVWRALTDPELLPLWSMRPEGFSLEVGARFKFYGKPNAGWRGFVECEMLEVEPLSRLRYSWVGNDDADKLIVTYTLEPRGTGTRLTVVHTGFQGVGGFMLAKFIMGPGWRKTLDQDFSAVLANTDEAGTRRHGCTLEPKF
jgi:uncharacterized protein YndB with AHSA1/START domain